jgi:hypothetical protein
MTRNDPNTPDHLGSDTRVSGTMVFTQRLETQLVTMLILINFLLLASITALIIKLTYSGIVAVLVWL